MASIILSEASGKLAALYGEYQLPIASIIEHRAEAWEQESMVTKIFDERKSTHASESYGGLTEVDAFAPVGEAAAYPVGGFEQGYFKDLRNVEWKGAIDITRTMIEDAGEAEMRKRANKLVSDFYRKREMFFARLMATALNGATSFTLNGFTYSTTTADGVCAFSKTHKQKIKGKNQSNAYAADLTVDNLSKMITAMQNMEDDDGNILGLVPDTLVIPNIASLKTAAYGIFGSEKLPGSGNNDANMLYGNMQVIVWPYLNQFITAGTSPWFIMDSNFNKEADCAIFQNRVDLTIEDMLTDNDVYRWKGRARYTGGFVDFRGLMAGGISGGTAI